MAIVIVVVIVLLYVPLGILPVLPKVGEEAEDYGESGL